MVVETDMGALPNHNNLGQDNFQLSVPVYNVTQLSVNSIAGSASHWYGWNREKKGLKEDTVTELPAALWKSNYCDNIHSNQTNGWKLEGREQQTYHLVW